MRLSDALEFMPCEPQFNPLAVYRHDSDPDYDATIATNGVPKVWCSLRSLRCQLGISESGLTKIRERLRNSYEHRDQVGRVFVYTPLWFRAWAIDKSTMR